jgi:hypothetical protein
MTEFSEDFQRILQSRLNPNSFPQYQYGYDLAERGELESSHRHVDRIQVQIDTTRFAFIARHPKHHHFCGYVLMPEQDWVREAGLFHKHSPFMISLAMPAYDPVCWMGPNTNGKFNSPLEITKADFWVGFDSIVNGNNPKPNTMNHEYALACLNEFESAIHAVRYGHLIA